MKVSKNLKTTDFYSCCPWTTSLKDTWVLEYLCWLSDLEGCQDFQSKGEVCSWSPFTKISWHLRLGQHWMALTDFTEQREKCLVDKGGVPPDSSGQVRCRGQRKEEHTEKNEFISGVNVVGGFLLEKKHLAAGSGPLSAHFSPHFGQARSWRPRGGRYERRAAQCSALGFSASGRLSDKVLKLVGMRQGSAGQTGQDRLTGKGARPRGEEIRPRPFATSQRSDPQLALASYGAFWFSGQTPALAWEEKILWCHLELFLFRISYWKKWEKFSFKLYKITVLNTKAFPFCFTRTYLCFYENTPSVFSPQLTQSDWVLNLQFILVNPCNPAIFVKIHGQKMSSCHSSSSEHFPAGVMDETRII